MGDEKMKRPTVYSTAGAMLQALENTLDTPAAGPISQNCAAPSGDPYPRPWTCGL